jgi:acetolactate synthase-1/2/3 large subunit
MAEALDCYAEYAERPEEMRPALQRAWKKVDEGMETDYRARATTVRFSSRET